MSEANGAELEALLTYMKEARGFDFTAYKRGTLSRRINRRMISVGASDYGEYADYLQVHPDEFVALFNAILINVTSFFRDPEAWHWLSEQIVPRLLGAGAAESREKEIRVWSAGCSSGEEAYTIAIVLAEAMGKDAFRRRVKIYATDIDEEALATARQGTYTEQQVKPVSARLRARYFDRVGDRFSFTKELRRNIIFGRHDLLQDAPISRIDLLISRNTLMYLNADAQTHVLSRFHYALNEGGVLFLGKAETLLSRSQDFRAVDLRFRVFEKPLSRPSAGGAVPLEVLPAVRAPSAETQLLGELAYKTDPVAQVILDASLSIALANDAALDLLDMSASDIGRPFSELVFSYRPVELRSPVNDALVTGTPVRLHEVMLSPADGADRWFDVEVSPVLDSRSERIGVRILFIDRTRVHELTDELQRSQADLETANEELQSSNEELETTNQELQSTVEELETTNEELQSTNEELETMNEELHSTNEELEAANDQLRVRTLELGQSAAFLESILMSMKAAVVVVGTDLSVRAWSRRAEDLWGVRPSEAVGTHFSNLDIGLPVDDLLQPIRNCLAGRSDGYETTLPATNRRGKPIACRVTLNQLKDAGGATSGVVILMDEESRAS